MQKKKFQKRPHNLPHMLTPPSGWLPVLADPEAIAGDIIALAETDLPLVLQLRAENREKDTDNLFKSYSKWKTEFINTN